MTGHLAYVAASYAVAALAVIGLILWVILDGRAQKRALEKLNAAGIRRRSDGGGA